MVLNAFARAPWLRYLPKLVIPSAGIFALGILALGTPGEPPARVIASERIQVYTPPFTTGWAEIRDALDSWFKIPGACRANSAASGEIKAQCSEFWNQLTRESLHASLPFVALLGFLALALGQFGYFYRRARASIATGQAVLIGRATGTREPRERDLFSWIFCVKPVAIQVSAARKVRAYVAEGQAFPSEGQKMAVFRAGKFLGRDRYVAVIYHPHLAIISA